MVCPASPGKRPTSPGASSKSTEGGKEPERTGMRSTEQDASQLSTFTSPLDSAGLLSGESGIITGRGFAPQNPAAHFFTQTDMSRRRHLSLLSSALAEAASPLIGRLHAARAPPASAPKNSRNTNGNGVN